MASFSAILAAVAATVAAGLTGLNLYVTGRREHGKWIRDALIEAHVSYLNASFESGSATRRLLDEKGFNLSDEARQELIVQIRRNRRTQNEFLTRLRLLADGDVVRAAERLLLADRIAADLALIGAGDSPIKTWGEARELLWRARNELVQTVRESMHLGPGVTVDPNLKRWPAVPVSSDDPDGRTVEG